MYLLCRRFKNENDSEPIPATIFMQFHYINVNLL